MEHAVVLKERKHILIVDKEFFNILGNPVICQNCNEKIEGRGFYWCDLDKRWFCNKCEENKNFSTCVHQKTISLMPSQEIISRIGNHIHPLISKVHLKIAERGLKK